MFGTIGKNSIALKKILNLKTQRGQSLVEMAIILPLLIFMLLGVFEVGNAVRNYMVLANVNREITRFAVRPGYMNFSTIANTQASYQSVRNWVDGTLSGQLNLDFSDTGNINDTGDATLIVSHIVIDTGLPCEDIVDKPKLCDCDRFLTDSNYSREFTLDDLIVHPGLAGMEFQSQRFGPAQTVTGERSTRIDYEALVQDLKAENNAFNCELIKKGGISSANNLIITELYLDQPQMFGFPFISNPYTDPVPLYSHTSMRLIGGARSTGSQNLLANIDTIGPICMAYPITFGQDIFDDPDNPTTGQLIDAYEGNSPGNFGWVTWNPASGNNNANYVEQEMKIPLMSMNDYTNVLDSSDHSLSIGDAVSTGPGVMNSSGVEDQLQLLVGQEIIVPVYSNNPGSGSGSHYQISHFAKIRIDQVCLPRNGQTCDGKNSKQIKAYFEGYVDDTCTDNGGGGGGNPSNQSPIAQNDTASTTKNVTTTIDVLANDSDPDGDHADLMIAGVTEGSGFKGTLQVVDDVAGWRIIYQPKNNDTGTYDFTYTIQDADGGTATATVVINVTN